MTREYLINRRKRLTQLNDQCNQVATNVAKLYDTIKQLVNSSIIAEADYAHYAATMDNVSARLKSTRGKIAELYRKYH